MDTFLNEMEAIMYTTIVASYYEAACAGLHYTKTTVKKHTDEITDLVKRVSTAVTTQISTLPNDYITYQLRNDVVNVVLTASSTHDCATMLGDKIKTKMKGWRNKPLASTCCYNPVVGWNQHAFSAYQTKNEYYGFFNEFHMYNKFSVIVDWTSNDYDVVDVNRVKGNLEYHLGIYGSVDISNPDF